MKKLLQIDFPYQGPFGKQMAEAYSGLAQSICEEPGLIWKIWTENEAAQASGGIYLFESEETARAYLIKHTERLKEFGFTNINAKIFDVNTELSGITKAPMN